MAKKGPMPSYETVDDYIAAQSPEAQKLLHELRAMIKEAAPDATEVPNYKVPTFKLIPDLNQKHQMMVAAYAKFVSFYPSQATVEHFSDDLKGYKQGKGSVQFPFGRPLPKELIRGMVKFRIKELTKA